MKKHRAGSKAVWTHEDDSHVLMDTAHLTMTCLQTSAFTGGLISQATAQGRQGQYQASCRLPVDSTPTGPQFDSWNTFKLILDGFNTL